MTNLNQFGTQQFVKNSFWNTLLVILGKGGGLIFTIILARFLLPEKYGAYSLILSLAILFMAFGDLGINQALTIFFSKYLKNKKKANAYFNYLFKIKIMIVISTSILLLISSGFLTKHLFGAPELTLPLMAAAIYIFFFSLSGFFTSFFYIYRKVKIDFFKECLFQGIRLITVLGVFLFLSSEFYLLGVFISLIIASLIMNLFTIIYTKKLAPFIFIKQKETIDKNRVFKFLFYLMVGSISLIIFSEIDIFMIGLLVKDLSFIGYYKTSFALVFGVSSLLGFGAVLLPMFSAFKKERLSNAFNKVINYLFILSVPFSFGLLAFGRYFIQLFFGKEYLSGSLALSFLAFLVVSESATGILRALLSAEEKPKFIAKSLVTATILNIVLNYCAIKILLNVSLIWAIAGAAIATLLSRYFYLALLIYFSKRELNISFKIRALIKPLIASTFMYVILSILISYVEMNLFIGICLIILGICIYVFLMFLIKGITLYDFKIFKLVIRHIPH